jgi:sarcosine oxidase subunit delta
MLIDCPYCGERLSEEFTILGDATKQRPAGSAASDMDAWYDYVFIRDNPKGRHREYWQHTGGCRAWLVVERDTLTHQVYAVTPARDVSA